MIRKQITGGAIISYCSIIFSVLSGLLYMPWMIKSIGDEQYALYVLAISIINLFLLDFGIGTGVTKFLSEYYAKGDQRGADDFIGIVLKIFLLISFVIGICLLCFYCFIDNIYINLTIREIQIFKKLFIIVSIYSIISFPFLSFNGVLMANEKFILLKSCNLGQQILTVVLIIIFIIMDYGVYSLVLVNAVSNIVFIVIKYICIKKSNQKINLKSWSKTVAKELFGYSAWMTVITISQRCIFNIMPTIIAAILGSLEVTIFSLAALLEGYVYTFAEAINGMFMPHITKIIHNEEATKKIQDLMNNVGKYHVYTLGLLLIGFICVGTDFIELWMGTGYESIYICTIILILPSMVHVPQQVAKTSLLVCDVVKTQAIIYAIMAVSNIILSIVLIPQWGIIGAAVSVLISYTIRTVGLNYLYKTKLGVSLKTFFSEVYGRWIIISIITLIIGFPITRLLPFEGLINLVISAIIITLLYGSLTLRWGLNKCNIKKLIN